MNGKNVIYNLFRDKVKRILTQNLGQVVEDDDKITCYVNQKKIKKINDEYIISCWGISIYNKELASKYGLNKPICYVVDGLNFPENKVSIYSLNDCEVIIRNCHFGFDTYMNIDGKCTIDCSFIKGKERLEINANDLVIKNISNQLDITYPNDLPWSPNICFRATNGIYILDSDIDIDQKKILISAKNEIIITNSTIKGQRIECSSKEIRTDNSELISNTAELHTNSQDINITAPNIWLNGEYISGRTLQKKRK